MPVGTRATVKSLTPEQVAAGGAQIILANTYHLLLRPGPGVVAQLGGLQRFSGWNGPMLTDSGGFQVFSLADLRRLDDDGVEFRSHIDGSPVRLTPQCSIETQNALGADIIMAFDECPALGEQNVGTWGRGKGDDRVCDAVRRTILWARRSKEAHARRDQALYGIVQGGLDLDLRQRCIDELIEIGFDGYAIGGLSVGEPPPAMWALLDAFADRLPADRPRYLMGVGRPIDIVRAVAAGVDQFDCVLPTRNGRKGYAFTSRGVTRLRNAAHKLDSGPLDPLCGCYCCRNFSRGYLRHLFMCEELLGGTLVSLHNLAFYQSLMRAMREAIERDVFAAWMAAYVDAEFRMSNSEYD
ncbi:Queuine tRNA-ribosyltransferase [Phycisphaerae bacterium RAS1]|nr:Queuine tRNA-ribosyltransferase [Phycisphaerae bacterium RAS1]